MSIKYHPKHELLSAFVAGELPASLSIAVSAHNELCDDCRKKCEALTESQAIEFIKEGSFNEFELNDFESINDEFDEMFAAITAEPSRPEALAKPSVNIDYKGQSLKLPRALTSVTISNWQKLGKLRRAKLELAEGKVHSNLLEIEAGGTVPTHTHKGYELTLLLAGSFSDEHDTYLAGDFIWLNQHNTHTPVTDEGCLCFTVADDAQTFTQGISKLLNPIGRFIY
jgi:putative transcriptional regulator